MTAHDLVTDLGRAYREGRLDRRLRVYLAPKVLVIDEMGYLPLDELGATIFFQLVSARYERGSIMLDIEQELWRVGLDLSAIRSSRRRSWIGCCTTRRRSTSAASYRLKERRKAGLLPHGSETGPQPEFFRSPGLRYAQNAPQGGAGLRSGEAAEVARN